MDIFAFDIPTIMMVNFFISIVVVGGLSFHLWERQVCPGMYHWVVGLSLIPLGFFFLFFRIFAELELSIVVGNGLLLSAFVCFWLGLRTYTLEIKPTDYWLLVVGPLTSVALVIALHAGASELIRAQVFTTVLILLHLISIYTTLNNRPKSEYGRLVLAITLTISVINSIFRFYTLSRPGGFTILNPDLSNLIAMLNSTFVILGVSFSFMLIGSQWLQHKLSVHAMFDSLTGVYNQYGLSQKSGLFFHPGSSASSAKRCILMIDIDGFRNINAQYGHQIGDIVLKEATQRIHRNIREEDVFARYTGEEFVVVLPETNGEAAKVWANRIKQIISSTPVLINQHKIELSVTIGIAELKERNHLEMEEAIRLSQQALNHAKRNGRNQVYLYTA